MSRVIVSIPQTCVRNFSVTGIRSTETVSPQLQKLKQKAEIMQRAEKEGVPMYLRGGTSDKVLYYTAAFLSFLSAGLAFHSTYECAVKK